MNPTLPKISTRWKTTSLRLLLWTVACFIVSIATLSTTGCRDTASVCKQYVQKYARCFRESHKRALIKQRSLPESQRKQMMPFLHKLEKKIKDHKWQKQAIKRCLQSPPSHKRSICIRDASCDSLSSCDPKRPS
jgi:hypothetical protein